MSAFLSPPSSGGSSLVRGSGALQGWTSYTPATVPVVTFAMPSIDDTQAPVTFAVIIEGVEFDYDFFPDDPAAGHVYAGAAAGSAATDASNLAAAINANQGGYVTASDDGQGNLTLTSHYIGSSSTIIVVGPSSFSASATGTDQVGPAGQIGSVTILNGVSGKTCRIVNAYAVADAITSWSGTLTLSYSGGSAIFVQSFSTPNGVLPLPLAGAGLNGAILQNGLSGQGITASFVSDADDDLDNFNGGNLEIVVICDQQ
jgi:hypothetical protein